MSVHGAQITVEVGKQTLRRKLPEAAATLARVSCRLRGLGDAMCGQNNGTFARKRRGHLRSGTILSGRAV